MGFGRRLDSLVRLLVELYRMIVQHLVEFLADTSSGCRGALIELGRKTLLELLESVLDSSASLSVHSVADFLDMLGVSNLIALIMARTCKMYKSVL